MARPKGSVIDDKVALMVMAGFIIDGKADNPWQASCWVAHLCAGASQDAIRRRLYRKFQKQSYRLKTSARQESHLRSRFELGSRDPLKLAVEEMHVKARTNRGKLDALLKNDPETAEVIHIGRVGDIPLADVLPDILDRLAKSWVSDFEQ